MFKQPSVGRITVQELDAAGRMLWELCARNTMTYAGIDLMARMLAWEDVKINMAYLEFVESTVAVVPSVAADPEEGRDYYQILDDGGGIGSDYQRVPLVVTPAITSSDEALFEGNRVTFNAFTSGDVGANGQSFGVGAKLFGLALVHAPDPDDRTQDIVFARGYFTAKAKVDNHQIAVVWSHTVGEVV